MIMALSWYFSRMPSSVADNERIVAAGTAEAGAHCVAAAAEIAALPGCIDGRGRAEKVTTSRLIGSAFRCGPTFSGVIGIASSVS